MNLLAHAILSPADEGVLVGNVVADWLKGRARLAVPAEIRAGFALHQRIDVFTDTHAVVGTCAARLEPAWGRYSSVLVDIFFDHLLAKNWASHSEIPFETFVGEVYRTLHAHRGALPERANFAICALTMDDWFSCYRTLDGIRLTLTRMSARLRHGVELAPAVETFFEHREFFGEAFERFFPELRRAVSVEAGCTV